MRPRDWLENAMGFVPHTRQFPLYFTAVALQKFLIAEDVSRNQTPLRMLQPR